MIPLVAVPASPRRDPDALVDLLTGDSSDFDGSLGGWVANGAGAAVAYDGAVGLDGKGSCKLTTTNLSGGGARLSLPGTFLSGVTYQVRVALLMEAYSGAVGASLAVVDLGDIAAVDTSVNNEQVWFTDGAAGTSHWDISMPFDQWVWNVVEWTPTANRTAVFVRVRMATGTPPSGGWVIHVGQARVVRLGPSFVDPGSGRVAPRAGLAAVPVGLAMSSGLAVMPLGQNQGQAGWEVPSMSGPGTHVRFAPGGVDLAGSLDGNGDQAFLSLYSIGAYSYGNQSAIGRRAALAAFDGWAEEYGPDYLGTIRSERSATEIEWMPDGDYDVILVDGNADAATHRWWAENADGTEKSALGLLHLLKDLGSTDPSAGGGVAAAAPRIGVRLNAGATELWLKTGAGDTAWTKITVP